jgi:hypothetical protein
MAAICPVTYRHTRHADMVAATELTDHMFCLLGRGAPAVVHRGRCASLDYLCRTECAPPSPAPFGCPAAVCHASLTSAPNAIVALVEFFSIPIVTHPAVNATRISCTLSTCLSCP